MKSIPYGRQNIDKDDIAAVVRALKEPFITQGPMVHVFEQALCKYTGAKYGVVVSSGTAALHAACVAAGIGPGDEVIVPANTFAASSNSVIYAGAKPIFVDVDLKTGNLDIKSVLKHLTSKTAAIMGVDYAGQPCDWGELRQLADKKKLLLIDDASHALGASYTVGKSRYKIGCSAHADLTTLSFHPLKTITTGEGGAILTNDKKLYDHCLRFRSHGLVRDQKQFVVMPGRLAKEKYMMQMLDLGFNYRLTDIQCALGVSQLKKIDRFVKNRAAIDVRYRRAFKDNPYFDMLELKELDSSFHLFPILVKDPEKRGALIDHLNSRGIGTQVHYIPIYWHPFYQTRAYKQTQAIKAEEFFRREVSLPIHPQLKPADQNSIIQEVLKWSGWSSEIKFT